MKHSNDQKRGTFTFDQEQMARTYEERQTRALEFIAHYLDRIEQKLERITVALDPKP